MRAVVENNNDNTDDDAATAAILIIFVQGHSFCSFDNDSNLYHVYLSFTSRSDC